MDSVANRFQLESLQPACHGGYGEIYFATDSVSGKSVALKVARRPGAAEQGKTWEDVRESIYREAAILGRLRHPNVIEFVAQGSWIGRPFFAMERINGLSLLELAQEPHRFGPHEKELCLAQAASALAYTHEQGIVHLDVKPENFIRANGSRLVLLDFGTARLASAAVVPGPGSAVTPAYSAPEQFRAGACYLEGNHLTGAADVFAFAVMAFELLTGVHPFGGNDAGVMYRIVEQMAGGNFEEMCPGINRSACRLLSEALRKQPGRRPPAKDLAAALAPRASSDGSITDRKTTTAGVDGTLISGLRASLENRQFGRASTIWDRLDPEKATIAQRRELEALRMKWKSLENADNEIPRILQQCAKLRDNCKPELEKLSLDRAIHLDAQHPAVIDYQIQGLRQDLVAADDRWEEGRFVEAGNLLGAVEKYYDGLLGRSALAQQCLQGTTGRWKSAVSDACQALSRAKAYGQLESFLQSVGFLLDLYPDLQRESRRALATASGDRARCRREFTATTGEALSAGAFMEVSQVLREARAWEPAAEEWIALERRLREAREQARNRDNALIEEARQIRKAIAERNWTDAERLIASGEERAPGHPIWPDLRRQRDRGLEDALAAGVGL